MLLGCLAQAGELLVLVVKEVLPIQRARPEKKETVRNRADGLAAGNRLRKVPPGREQIHGPMVLKGLRE